MSIINEALKKAQKEKESSFPLAGTELRLHKKQGFNWGPIFVLLVLFMITGPIIAPFFAAPFKKEASTSNAISKTVSVGQSSLPDSMVVLPKNPVDSPVSATAHQGQFGIEESPILPPSPGPIGASPSAALKTNFSLSGIVYSPKESYCIINDKVVKVGERVGGATLLAITPEKVVLDYQGETIALA